MSTNIAMNGPRSGDSHRLAMYAILIAVTVGSISGRIMNPAPGTMPSHADNDRSRWDTVRALVDQGTYVIGKRSFSADGKTYQDSGICTEEGWKTIDRVIDPATGQFYSSKPPLLPTLAAGEYWVLKKLFGWSITDEMQRWHVMRVILITFNVLPLLVALVLLGKIVEEYGQSDWGRMFVMASACFGTLLVSFAITFNNHSVAACSAVFALVPAIRILEGRRSPWLFVALGAFAGFTTTCEYPALSFTALALAIALLQAPRQTLLWAIPAALLVLATIPVGNYLATGEWRPAYDQFGGPWYEFDGSFWQYAPHDSKKVYMGIDWVWRFENRLVYTVHCTIGHHGIFSLTPIFLFGFLGMMLLPWHPASADPNRARAWRWLGLLSLVVTLVVLAFYCVLINQRNRNYGGWSKGLRWLMWLYPLWLLCMLPVVDWLARRPWGRWLGYVFLAISAFSAHYRIWNPWHHPWLYNVMDYLGWLQY